jgi:geranylgeranyl pyrophosphate synthase
MVVQEIEAIGARARAAVSDEIRRLLSIAPITIDYRATLDTALALPGGLLSDTKEDHWSRIVCTCCTAAGGRWENAVTVAACVEIFMVALDVLDDEEDVEDSWLHDRLGMPLTLNASTGLLLLAQWGLLSVGAGGARSLLDAGLRACSGQHADLSVGGNGIQVGLEDSLSVTATKSASLVAGISRLGAWCAGACESVCELYERFGWYVGMVKQLTNDMSDTHPTSTAKTDIALGRPTLPLAYAKLGTRTRREGQMSEAEMRTDLWTDGGVYLTWAIAETYRRRALDMLPDLTPDFVLRDNLAALLPKL